MSAVHDAVEIASGGGLRGDILGASSAPSEQRIARLQSFIMRFLENIDEDMTVLELREELTHRDEDDE